MLLAPNIALVRLLSAGAVGIAACGAPPLVPRAAAAAAFALCSRPLLPARELLPLTRDPITLAGTTVAAVIPGGALAWLPRPRPSAMGRG